MQTGDSGQKDVTCLMDVLEAQPADKPDVEVGISDYATMNFTGGTTGMPKGVLHKHQNVIYTGACGYTYFLAHLLVEKYQGQEVDYNAFLEKTAATEVGLAGMPIFWIAGNDMGVVFPMFAGGTIVLLYRWDPQAALEVIEKYGVTSTYATFDQYMQFLQDPEIGKYDLSSLRTCTGSSFINPLTSKVRKKWKDLTGAILREASYGLTETHTMDTMTAGFHKNDIDIKRQETEGGTFCGIPFPGTRIKITDNDGNPVPPGQDGQILITSPSVVEGYLGKPEETAKSFQGGWLHTGDVGKYDEDGFFYYLSRTKYMLKVSGVSVYPAQIEFILLAHPEVELVGVIGVKDEKKGEAPVAFVKLKPGSQITEKELLDWSKKNMSPHNVPKEIRIRDSLPLTATGKVIREELMEKKE
jgi:acyl-CoA synthetase (AMP-forming)/AMP-acid ligase II